MDLLRARWRTVLLIVAIIATTGVFTKVGVWRPESPLYWRQCAQAAVLYAATHAPARFVARLTLTAIRTYPIGLSYGEMEQAAVLFDRVNEKEAASKLWLALTRLDIESNNVKRAQSHALLARNAHASEQAYISLINLTRHSPEKRMFIAEFQTVYADHQLARAFGCLDALQSLDTEPPRACGTLDWVRQRAQAGREQYISLTEAIENLPIEAARNISEAQRAILRLTHDQSLLVNRHRTLVAELDDLEHNGAWAAGIEGAIKATLPIPKPNDTLETWLTREGICLLPIVRWFCRVEDFTEPFAELQRKRQALTSERDNIAQKWRSNESTLHTSRASIKYWQSTEPLNKLVGARDALLPSFRKDVERAASNRYPKIGISTEEAITAVTTPQSTGVQSAKT